MFFRNIVSIGLLVAFCLVSGFVPKGTDLNEALAEGFMSGDLDEDDYLKANINSFM